MDAVTAITLAKTDQVYPSFSLSDFDVGQRIGKGQFSVVYKARCKRDNQTVALKKVQIFEMTDSKARADCMKEIQLLQVENSNYFSVSNSNGRQTVTRAGHAIAGQ